MKILYVKNNHNRSNKYQLRTIIYEENGKRFIKKEAIKKEAIEHLKQMKRNYTNLLATIVSSDIRLVKIIDETHNSLTFEYIDGMSYDVLFDNAVKDGEKSVKKFIFNFKRTLKNGFKVKKNMNSSDELVKLFGNIDNSKLKNKFCFDTISNIDLIFSNLIYKDNVMYIIDYEWVYNYSVPLDFIIYRSINERLNTFNHSSSSDILNLFDAMEVFFQNNIVQDQSSFSHVQKKYQKKSLLFSYIVKIENIIFKILTLYKVFFKSK